METVQKRKGNNKINNLNRMKRGVLITFIAVLIPWILQAQTTPDEPRSLTLEEAVNFGVERH